MIAGLLRRFRNRRADAWLARSPEEYDLATLVPIILPPECLTDAWPGPIAPLGRLPFAVAWAIVPRPNRFLYATDEEATYWQERGIDWRAEAMQNLARISKGCRWGNKRDAAGRPFLFALLADDALGPSRLLLPHLFDGVLGPDYRVAIPEQTCAIAYRADLDAGQQAEVDAIIEGCFRHGTEPMSDECFDAAEFWVPLG